MKAKSVFLFCSGIDDVLSGSSKVAGIQVQMSFWARTFAKYGWRVFSFSENKQTTPVAGICFVDKMKKKWLSKIHLDIVQEWLDCWRCVKIHPDIVVFRGASRYLFFLSRLCRKKNIPLLVFGASDTDFVPGKEIVSGSSTNRKLYQKAIVSINLFVTQNELQRNALKQYYDKDSLMIPNIWIPFESQVVEKKYDAVWIANLRPLKRAEWFVKLAEDLPQYKFTVVGGNLIKDYSEKIEKLASNVSNLILLGAQPFNNVNKILSESRLLVCTSEFEGFPNTFLQAWSQAIPVVSTVNPSDLITKHHLGVIVDNQESLKEQTIALLSDEGQYDECVNSIKSYFLENHSAEKAYDKLCDYYPNIAAI